MTEHNETHEHKEEKKEEPRKEHRPKKSTVSKTLRHLVWASWIQIILLAIIVFQLSSTGDVSTDTPTPEVPDIEPGAPLVDMDILIDDDSIKGDSDAPVTIVEFSDYECSFCARFYVQTLQQIEEKYIDTGKVKLIFRDFPLNFHRNAQKAAEAAECAGEQGKYYEMHDALFDNGVSGGVASFKTFASDIGLNIEEFNVCLDTGAMASEIQKDFADGQRAGVKGTPAFFVNGNMISGAQPFAAFEQAIEAALQ